MRSSHSVANALERRLSTFVRGASTVLSHADSSELRSALPSIQTPAVTFAVRGALERCRSTTSRSSSTLVPQALMDVSSQPAGGTRHASYACTTALGFSLSRTSATASASNAWAVTANSRSLQSALSFQRIIRPVPSLMPSTVVLPPSAFSAVSSALSLFVRPNSLLTQSSSSLLSTQQVVVDTSAGPIPSPASQARVVFRPGPSSSHQPVQPRTSPSPSPSSNLSMQLLVSCISILLTRAKLHKQLRDQVPNRLRETEALKSIRREAHRLVKEAFQSKQAITTDERLGINEYTGRWYEMINNALRSGQGDRMTREKTAAIVGGLNKQVGADKVYTGKVYRGTHLPASVQDALKPGATYLDPAFLSTSQNRQICFDRFWKSKRRSFTLFRIESKTGVDVSAWSTAKNKVEREVLFRPGTLFRIQSSREVYDLKHGPYYLVTMAEIH